MNHLLLVNHRFADGSIVFLAVFDRAFQLKLFHQ